MYVCIYICIYIYIYMLYVCIAGLIVPPNESCSHAAASTMMYEGPIARAPTKRSAATTFPSVSPSFKFVKGSK